jgi:integral membrane protein
MFKSTLSTLRNIGNIEGISYLILLGIAMPLKYLAGMPMAVRVVGSIHGFLFVAFCWALIRVWIDRRWSFGKVTMAFIASLLPFGTFILDRKIREEESLEASIEVRSEK